MREHFYINTDVSRTEKAELSSQDPYTLKDGQLRRVCSVRKKTPEELSTDQLIDEYAPVLQAIASGWEHQKDWYVCDAVLVPEEEGGYSAFAQNLPGVASEGEDEESALENVLEAFILIVSGYLKDGEEIPWERRYSIGPDHIRRTVSVKIDHD